MAIERKDPIPIGKYWVDALDEIAIFYFDTWAIRNSGTVKVIKKEENPPGWLSSSGRRNWYLFEVTAPTPRWQPVKNLGLPTIVQSPTAPTAAPVTSSADTATRPPPPTPSSMFGGMFDDAKTVAIVLGVLYLATRK
jgi:hypothetical protein